MYIDSFLCANDTYIIWSQASHLKKQNVISEAIGKCQGEMLFEIGFKAKTSKPSDLFLLLFLVLQLPHILWFPFRMYLKWNSRKRSKRNWNEGVLRVYAYLNWNERCAKELFNHANMFVCFLISCLFTDTSG